MKTLAIPDLLKDAGINIKLLDGWNTPHTFLVGGRKVPYVWRLGDPVMSMWHHTATSGYSPNRDKGSMYAGLYSESTGRLYQSGGGEPTLVIANAYPAPISSGYGQKSVIDKAKADVRNDSLARGSDDNSPRYAANRDAWNTEVVLDGVGTWIDEGVWEMITRAAVVIHEHMGWSDNRALGHAQFTNRKIDLRDGRVPSAKETMIAFRAAMSEIELGEEEMLKIYDMTWMTMFHSGVPGVSGYGRYYCSDDGTVDWMTENFEGLHAPWGSNSHPTAPDGRANEDEKVNAFNYLLMGFAEAAGDA